MPHELRFWLGDYVEALAKDVLQRLLSNGLLGSLEAACLESIKDLHVIESSDSDRVSFVVSFIQILFKTKRIVLQDSPVLHQLNLSLLSKVSRASLRPVVHNGHLEVGAA